MRDEMQPPVSSVSGLFVAMVIARRDLTRFVRQPARIAAAVATPVLLWLLFGSGFAGSFRPAALGETTYAAFLLPGAMTLVAVFSSILSSISVIEDRNEGWLRAAVVSPAPRWSLAMGKVVGGAVVSFAQAAVLLAVVPLLNLDTSLTGVGLTIAALMVTSFAMTALGFIFAWHCETTASFHAVMNVVFMPMWLLSGALFPADADQAGILAWLMQLNPLTWCTQAIREPLMNRPTLFPLAAAAAFGLIMFVGAVASVRRDLKS